jgi:hypothetical protein
LINSVVFDQLVPTLVKGGTLNKSNANTIVGSEYLTDLGEDEEARVKVNDIAPR